MPMTMRAWSPCLLTAALVAIGMTCSSTVMTVRSGCCYTDAGFECPCDIPAADFAGSWMPPFSSSRKLAVIDMENTVERMQNGGVVLGKAAKHPRRLFAEDKPWERRIDNGYPNVHHDPSQKPPFKLWYDCCIEVSANNRCNGMDEKAMLYAESDDGINWRKPSLGLEHYHGSAANNIVLKGVHGLGVYRDPHERDPSRSFKAFGEFSHFLDRGLLVESPMELQAVIDSVYEDGWFFTNGRLRLRTPVELQGIRLQEGAELSKYKKGAEGEAASHMLRSKGQLRQLNTPCRIFFKMESRGGLTSSPDGLHWTKFRRLRIKNRWETHSWIYWDWTRREYAGLTRGQELLPNNEPNRTVVRFSLSAWDGEPEDLRTVFASASDRTQPYSLVSIPFYNIYLGFVNTYDADVNLTTGRIEDKLRCELLWSPDSLHWHKLSHQGRRSHETELIITGLNPEEKHDAYDCFYANPVVVNNEVWLYYMGGDGPHGSFRNTSFNLAKMRMDGFAGIAPTVRHEPAQIFTKVLNCLGSDIMVTADVFDGGSVRAAILGANSEALPNRGIEDSVPLRQTATDHRMAWRTQGASSDSAAGAVRNPSSCRVRFEVQKAVLYTFGWPESHERGPS